MTHRGSRRSVRLLVATVPLSLSGLLVPLLAGPLSLGGGEKDVLLAFPLLVWSALYLILSLALWWRRVPPGRTALWAGGLASLVCALALGGLYVWALTQYGA